MSYLLLHGVNVSAVKLVRQISLPHIGAINYCSISIVEIFVLTPNLKSAMFVLSASDIVSLKGCYFDTTLTFGSCKDRGRFYLMQETC